MEFKLIVNHVMSNDVKSGIFDSILQYFKDYTSADIEIKLSIKPIENADVFHYHRINLESRLQYPAVATVHHDLLDTDAWLDKNRFIDRYRECDAVICLNTQQKNILDDLGVDSTFVVPHGVRTDIIKPLDKPALQGRKIRIGLFSKRYDRKVKGEAYFAELIKYLDPDLFEWVFVGDGRTVECWKARELGYQAQVYEYLPYGVFGDLYRSIDFLLMCSWFEGGPANIPEAIASGTPILGFNVGMAGDFIIDGENGMFLTGDPVKDGRLILELAKDKNAIVEMQKKSLLNVGSALSWKKIVNNQVEIYREIVAQGSIDRQVV